MDGWEEVTGRGQTDKPVSANNSTAKCPKEGC